MKRKFTILTLVFSILSNTAIAEDSTISSNSGNQKNSRFEEKLPKNKEKRQQRSEINQGQQASDLQESHRFNRR